MVPTAQHQKDNRSSITSQHQRRKDRTWDAYRHQTPGGPANSEVHQVHWIRHCPLDNTAQKSRPRGHLGSCSSTSLKQPGEHLLRFCTYLHKPRLLYCWILCPRMEHTPASKVHMAINNTLWIITECLHSTPVSLVRVLVGKKPQLASVGRLLSWPAKHKSMTGTSCTTSQQQQCLQTDDLPHREWAALNHLRNGVGRFKISMKKWHLADSAPCEYSDTEQTTILSPPAPHTDHPWTTQPLWPRTSYAGMATQHRVGPLPFSILNYVHSLPVNGSHICLKSPTPCIQIIFICDEVHSAARNSYTFESLYRSKIVELILGWRMSVPLPPLVIVHYYRSLFCFVHQDLRKTLSEGGCTE